MSHPRRPEDLSVDELRRLLIEKRRASRQTRLDAFRQTGRIIPVNGQAYAMPLAGQPATRERSRRKVWFDRALFLIEFAAVVGLVFVLLTGFNVLSNLNNEVASVLTQPTLAPTPMIMAVVLPSGHIPPTGDEIRPNEAEIPEHLRPLMQSLADLPLPTPSPEQAVRIQIPAIEVDAPIVQGDGWEQLKKGVGQHNGTPNPGSQGNVVLSAHNDVFGRIFMNLDKLKEGDAIILYTNQRAHTYLVRQTQIVEPTQVDVMAPTQEAVVTLISCYPYMIDNQRIVVTGYMQ